MKGTWAILNTIIKKGHQAPSYPQEFVDNGSVVKNSMDIANGFNKCFVDIGQNLAKNIEPPSENVRVENFLGNSNNQSICLSSVEESEIIEIVKNWKNKKSTGFDNINMTIVKQVISHVVKPLSYICNMSLLFGT